MQLRESATRLLRLDPLLVRHDGFPEDLLAWSTGERTWATAAEEYLREGCLVEAAGAFLRVSNDDEVQDSLRADIEKQWEKQRAEMLQRIDELYAQSKSLSAPSSNSDLQEFLDEANGRLEDCRVRLGRAESLEELARMEPAMLRDIQHALGKAAETLELVSTEVAERVNRRREERKKLAQAIDGIYYDLLENPSLVQQAEKLDDIKQRAYKYSDVTLLERVLDAAQALTRGESVDLSALRLATQAARAPAAQPRMPTPKPHQVPASRSPGREFSLLTSANLAEGVDDGQPKSKQDYQPDMHYEPAGMKKEAELQADIAATIRYLSALEPSDKRLDRAMGIYLLQQAKLYLVQKNFLNARTVFGDVLVWLSDYANSGKETEISLGAWRSTGIWGFTVALLLLHEQQQDIPRILTPNNLKALFRYPFGELPLALLDRGGLFEEFGRQVLLLGSPAVDHVIHALSDYLNEHPIAKQEFLSGLFRQESPDLTTLCRILGLL